MTWPANTHTFTLDVESSSPVDLASTGAEVYWAHPDTQLVCVKYKVDDNPIQLWRPGDPIPYFVPEINTSGGWRVVAHNYLFEYWCWHHRLRHAGWGLPRNDRWDCTMARALYWGLPASLIEVASALNLKHQIDPAKKSRIKRMARPRAGTGAIGGPYRWWHEEDPVRLQELIDDCENDVATEHELDRMLPPLPAFERRVFEVDGIINRRGIAIDVPLVTRLIEITKAEGDRLNAEMSRLTSGRVTTTNQTARIMAELAKLGVPVPSLAKADVKTALADNRVSSLIVFESHVAQQILAVRQEAAKASTGKLKSMLKGMSADGTCKGLFQYGGAGRTLRWAGRRVQPQNYPRGTLKGVQSFIDMVLAGATVDDLQGLLPCSVMDAVSSALRGCLVPVGPTTHRGARTFVCGDLAQIEARVNAWLAGQNDVLEVFRRGEDVYTYTANKIGSTDRQLGKVLVLACGFQMGATVFQETARTYGIELTLHEAEVRVAEWRNANPKIVQFWWDVDREAKRVAASPHGTTGTVGKISFRKTSKALRIVLPSGRELTYQNVEVNVDPDSGRDELSYMGVHPKTKKWTRLRTYGGRLVENIVQATARDVMAVAMVAAEMGDVGNYPFYVVGTVHDELITQVHDDDFIPQRAERLKEIMSTPPSWAPGLPVAAECWTGKRYRK